MGQGGRREERATTALEERRFPYRYADLRELHLEPTSRCGLRCPMCARNVHGGPTSPLLRPTDLGRERFDAIVPDALLERLDTVLLCGNYGDPIHAQDLLPIIERVRSSGPRTNVILHTHGSARDTRFWARLAELDVRVTFGIDGLEDTLGVYRRGARWDRVIENARAFISSGGRARWQMLVFRHNEHEVERARALADEMGFERFKLKHSHRFYRASFVPRDALGRPDPARPPRFPLRDHMGRTVGHLEPPLRSDLGKPAFEMALDAGGGSGFRRLRAARPIACRVADPASVYVSAEGLVFPCCWTGNVRAFTADPQPHPVLRLARRSGGLEALRAPERSLQEIVEGPFFAAVAASWRREALETCRKTCGGGADLRRSISD